MDFSLDPGAIGDPRQRGEGLPRVRRRLLVGARPDGGIPVRVLHRDRRRRLARHRHARGLWRCRSRRHRGGDHDARGRRLVGCHERRVGDPPPPPLGVHPLPQPHQARGADGQGRPRHPRQLRRAQEGQGPRLARPPSTLDLPLHANLVLVAQCRRGLLRQTNAAQAQIRRLPIRRRPSGRHQPICPRIQ